MLQIRQKNIKMVLKLWPNVKKGSMNPLYKKGLKSSRQLSNKSCCYVTLTLLENKTMLSTPTHLTHTQPQSPIIPFVLGPLSTFNTSTSLHFQRTFMLINFHLKVGFADPYKSQNLVLFFLFLLYFSFMDDEGENLVVLCLKWI